MSVIEIVAVSSCGFFVGFWTGVLAMGLVYGDSYQTGRRAEKMVDRIIKGEFS